MQLNKKKQLLKPIIALSILIALCVCNFGNFMHTSKAHAHGYIGGNSNSDHNNTELLQSRAQLGRMGYNSNIGNVQYEPQSVEGPGSFPSGGPADGKLASAGQIHFSQLDQQTNIRWARQNIVGGSRTMAWQMTAPHVTKGFQYWITKDGWDHNAPLRRDMLEKFDEKDGSNVSAVTTHTINIPIDKRGYHIILGIWDIGDTQAAFYNAIDVHLHANASTITDRFTYGNGGSGDLGDGEDGGDNGNGGEDGGGEDGGDNGNGGGGENNTQLSMPVTHIQGGVLHWDAVSGATAYNVLHSVGTSTVQTHLYFSIEDFPGVQYLSVRAIRHHSDTTDSFDTGEWTPWITITGGIPDTGNGSDGGDGTVYQLDAPRLSLTGKYLTWPEVDNATNYDFVINGIHSQLNSTTLSIELPYTVGRHSIMVRATNGVNQSAWSTFTRTITDEFGNAPILETPSVQLIGVGKMSAKISKNLRGIPDSKFIVSHNGKISFHHADSVFLADLGLNRNDIKSGKHDVRIQAVNGQTSSEWSSRLTITDNNPASPWFSIILVSVGIASILLILSVFIRKKFAKNEN